MSDTLSVVVVDDHVELTKALLPPSDDECTYTVMDVLDLTDEESHSELETADVILVDHELRPLTDESPPQAVNGVALISVLREWLKARVDGRPMPLLALYTADQELVPAGRGLARSRVLPRAHSFDWAFAKSESEGLQHALPILAKAAREISTAFATSPDGESSAESTIAQLFDVLRIQDLPWAAAARREVLAAQPPVFGDLDLAERGLVLHWLLHRIVPYPTFLVDSTRAAARFGLARADFERLADSGLRDRLAAVEYAGALAGFDGPRYWRAGLEHVARDLADGFDSDALRSALSDSYGANLSFVEHPRPVVVLDHTLQPAPMPVAPGESVRIHVDDWPSYAEPPRMLRTTASDANFRYRVVEADRELLGAEPNE